MKLHIFLITVLPVCLAQFTIQGASDGNRVSQGLRYSEEKGIEYTDQSASSGAGDFTIQGATDGNTDFKIQGATDGHSNFQIQGPSQGAISTFNVQPPTDGHGQSIIRGPYDANQAVAATKSLQYNDPSGLRVNWKSYGHDRQPRLQQAQPEPSHYAEPSGQRALPPPQHRPPIQQQQQQQQQQPSYRPYNDAPAQIKQLLQFQAQIPYVNAIPEQFRYDHLAAAQAQAQQVQAKFQQEAQIPEYRGTKPPQRAGGPSRHRRQAPQHPQQAQQQQQQQQQQPQYRRLSQPPAEPVPRYSTNLPNNLQELLKYQAQIPYNIIANQIRYVPEKPYVPQPIQQQPNNPQTAQPGHYQGQGDPYQGQASTYTQSQINAYPQAYDQEQAGDYYGQGQGVRPVTENQY